MANQIQVSPRQRFLWAVFFLLVIGGATAVTIGKSRAGTSPPRTVSAPPAPVQTTTKPQLLVIHATPYGFDPDEITFPSGPTAVVIHNQMGLKLAQFRLSKNGPSAEGDELVKAGRGETPSFVKTLATGDFVLREDSTPDQLCRIHIQ